MKSKTKKKKKYRLKIFNSSKKKRNNVSKAKVNNINNKSKNKNIKKKKKTKRKLWKRLVTLFLILCIIGVLALAGFLAYIVITAPKFDKAAFNVNDQTVLYDIKGEVITTLGTQKRESVTYDELPQVLIDAIVATEDSKFFQHNGVDLLRFTKATIQQFMGQDAGGASTLTMQVAKNNLTQQGKQETNIIEKVVRKFHDVYLAVFKIEKKYSKEEIFEFYVNSYFLGGSSYGVEAASEYYFDKDVSELTLPEAALIAGLFQSPGVDNPYRSLENAEDRRDIVLKLMVRHGYITEEEAAYAKSISIESLLTTHEESNNFQGYVDTVVDEVKELTGGLNPYTVPMKIYTTMERSIQQGIDNVMNGKTSYKWKNKYVEAGIAVINSQTGAIAAIGAGRNKKDAGTFNYATQAYRQPGSTAKPIFAYGPGIEFKNMSSYTLFNDEKWGYSNGVNVNNWDGGYKGMVTMRYALQYSRNIPAIKAIQQVGVQNAQKFAYSLGFDVSLDQTSENYKVLSPGVDNTMNEAYAIGGAAKGFTPLQMAAGYAAYSNGGYYTKPYSVTKIEFRTTGEIKEYKNTKTRVMKDSTAYIMNNILESAVNVGFSGGAKISGSHVAAKTGTSNFDTATMKKYNLPGDAVNDLWTIAYTSKYAVSVWYGYQELTKEAVKAKAYNTGGGPKDNLTAAVMKYIPKDKKGWTKPSSVTVSKVELGTWPASLPSEYTPSSLITTEYFVRGSEPSEVSPRFAKLGEISNVNTSKSNGSVTISWEYPTPEIYTDKFLNNYFGQDVFGKQTSKFVSSAKSYSLPSIMHNGGKKVTFKYGTLGFGIYQKELDGTLTLLGFTTNNTYTIDNVYSNKTIVIKAEYQSYKSNASNGISIEIKPEIAPPTPPEPQQPSSSSQSQASLNVTLKENNVTATVGAYSESGISSVYYGTDNVTSIVNVTYNLNNNSSLKTYQTKEELVTEINKLPAGTYKVNFVVKYLGHESIVTKTITLK